MALLQCFAVDGEWLVVKKRETSNWLPCTSIKWKMPVMMDDRRWRSEISELKSKQSHFHVQCNLPTVPSRSTSRPCCRLEHLLLPRHCSTLDPNLVCARFITTSASVDCLFLSAPWFISQRWGRDGGCPAISWCYADCLAPLFLS